MSAGRSTTKVALVGGGSTGIGLETAKLLANEGYRVIIASQNPERGKQAAAMVGGTWLQVDFTSVEDTKRFCRDICFHLRPLALDVIVMSAGQFWWQKSRHD